MSASNRKIDFPVPTGPYKVHVNSGDWKPYTSARLQISMNNQKHTGDKFYAQAEWVKARFEKVQLIVSDTLHRHNIMASHGVDEKTAHTLALQIGDRWLEENAAAIALLPNKEITRWDDWLNHPQFATDHARVLVCHASDKVFAAEVKRTVESFLLKKGEIPDAQRTAYESFSRTYLLEEIAAFAVMHDTERMIDVRPGSPLKPVLDLLKSGTIENAPLGCRKIDSVVIDYTRNRAHFRI